MYTETERFDVPKRTDYSDMETLNVQQVEDFPYEQLYHQHQKISMQLFCVFGGVVWYGKSAVLLLVSFNSCFDF